MVIKGKNIDLHPVMVDDAEFILLLRLDSELNTHLSPVDDDIQKQKDWLVKSINDDKEHYFIVKNKQGLKIGTIRVYDIKKRSFCWGSWIILPEHRKYASLESMVLLMKFAFFDLHLEESNFDVRKENKKVVNFHLKSGAQIVKESDIDYFFNYKKEYFLNSYEHYQKIIDKITL